MRRHENHTTMNLLQEGNYKSFTSCESRDILSNDITQETQFHIHKLPPQITHSFSRLFLWHPPHWMQRPNIHFPHFIQKFTRYCSQKELRRLCNIM